MDTPTKTKNYKTIISASIATTAVVRSGDTEEKVKEYAANAFTRSMAEKQIAVLGITVAVHDLTEEEDKEIDKLIANVQNQQQPVEN